MRISALTESPPGDIEKQVNLLIPRVAAKTAYMIIMGWRTTMNKKAFTLIELLVITYIPWVQIMDSKLAINAEWG